MLLLFVPSQIASTPSRRTDGLNFHADIARGSHQAKGALRFGLPRGLGSGSAEWEEHLRRVAETARLLNDHGQFVLLAAQAPAREVRRRMADVIGAERTVEIHLHAPEDVRRQRDPSGVHAAVARGDVDGDELRPTLSADLDICAERYVKGFYARSATRSSAGEEDLLTGVDQAYEALLAPELVLNGARASAEELAATVTEHFAW